MDESNVRARLRTFPLAPVSAPSLALICALTASGGGHAQVLTTDGTPPPFLLAEVYQNHVDLEHYWVSEKLDGVRAWWNGEQLISRGGHIYNAPAWFTRDFPAARLDGELWMGRRSFEALSAAVRRRQPLDSEWRNIRFMTLDLPDSPEVFDQRLAELQRLAAEAQSPYLLTLPHRRVASRELLLEQLDRIVMAGGEGLMLRRGDARYSPGRSGALLKLKRWRDAEAMVIAHVAGKGRLEGLMGSLLVETADGRQFRLGTGFSDALRRDPPPPGTTVSYRYQGLTDEGIPRFAAFQRIHDPY